MKRHEARHWIVIVRGVTNQPAPEMHVTFSDRSVQQLLQQATTHRNITVRLRSHLTPAAFCARRFIFSDALQERKRSRQLMPLLWPRAGGQPKQGWLHLSRPIEGHHGATGVTAFCTARLLCPRPPQQERRIHLRALWWNWSLRSISTDECVCVTLLSLLQKKKKKKASVVDFDLFAIYLTLGSRWTWDPFEMWGYPGFVTPRSGYTVLLSIRMVVYQISGMGWKTDVTNYRKYLTSSI